MSTTTPPGDTSQEKQLEVIPPAAAAAAEAMTTVEGEGGEETGTAAEGAKARSEGGKKKKKAMLMPKSAEAEDAAEAERKKLKGNKRRSSKKKGSNESSEGDANDPSAEASLGEEEEVVVEEDGNISSGSTPSSTSSTSSNKKKKKSSSKKSKSKKKSAEGDNSSDSDDSDEGEKENEKDKDKDKKEKEKDKKDKEKKKPKKLSLFPKKKKDGKGDDADDDAGEHIADPDDTADKDKEKEKEKEKEKDKKKKPKKSSDTASGSSTSAASSSSSSHRRKKRDSKTPSTATTPSVPDDTLSASSSSMTATFVDDSATAPSPTEEPSPSPSMTPSEGFTIHVPPPPSSLSAAAAATATSSLPPSSSTVPTEAGLAASPAAIIIPPAPIVPGSPASIVIPPAPVPPAATVAGLPASPASIVIPPAPMPTGSPASIIIPPPPAAMTSSIGSPRTSVTAGVTAATATTASPSAAGLMSPGSAAAAASLKSPRNNVAPIQMQGSAQPQQQFGMRASPATPTMSAPWGLQPPAFGTEGGPHGARARAASSAPGCGYVILSNGLVVGNPTAAAAAAVAGGSPHGRTIDADLAGADKYEYEYEYEAPGSTSPSALAKNLARPNMKMPPPRLSALSASAGVGVGTGAGTAGVKPAMMATGTSPIVIKAQARGVPLHQQQLQQFERFKRQPGQGYQVQAQQQQQQQQQQHVVSSKYQDLMLPEGWEAAAAAKALDECSRFVLREAYESELLFVKAVDSLVDDFYTPLLQNVEKMRGKSKDSDKGTAKDAEKDKDKDKEKDKDKDKDAEKEKEKEKESTKEKDLEKSLENLFRGVGALRAVSRDVIRRLIDVAEAGEPYYLASLYAGAGEYVEAYGEFLRTHREGLIILQTLEERNSHFNRGLAACRSVCFPALGLVDIFWLVATRMTHVYKIAQDQAAYRRATDALGARLVAYEQFCTTRCGAPVLGPSARTCFPVAATTTAASSSSSSTAAAATAAAAAEEDLARLNTIHVRSTFLSEIYDGIGALRLIIPTPDESVPPTLHRKLLGSAEVFIRDKVPFGLSTDTPARAMFFNDGVALCRALPLPRQLQPHEGVQSVVQRKQHYQLVHWYPAAALTANKTGCEREVRIARWRNKQETKGKMPPGWEEETGKGGKHVYVNRVLGITQTHRPECAGAALSEAAVKLAAADPEAYEACVRLLRAVTGGAEIGEELGAGTAYAMVGTRLEPLLAYEQELYPGITVPTLPHTLCHHIIACGMGEQGIFRLAAEKRAIDDVCHQVNTGHLRDIKLGTLSIHIVTALLKTFLRELPDPLIPGALYNAFLACGEIEDPAVERAELARLIRELPPPNRDLLCELVAFGSQIAANTHVNSMDAGNLGIVIAPNILYKKGAKENITSMNISNNVIAFMIEHCTELFPGPSSFAAPSAAAVASAAATGGGCGSAIAGGASYKWASFKRKLLGHEKSIRVMGLSASGRTVVSIDGSGKAFVWDTASCAYVRSIELGIKYPMAIALVGQNFWVASQDAIHVYNSEDLSPVAQIQHPCFSLVYLETRGEVWAGSKGKVLILSVFNFSLLASFDDPDQTIYFAMAPAGPATIWCAGSAKSHDQSIHVWDCVSRREIAVFPAHTKRINALAADPAHNTVWSAAEDHTIGVWDASSFRLIHRIARHNSAVNALCVLSDQVWSSSWDRSLMIWDPASARYLGEIKGYHSDYVSRILPVTTPSGSTDVWTQSVDICVWSVAPAPPIIEDTFTL